MILTYKLQSSHVKIQSQERNSWKKHVSGAVLDCMLGFPLILTYECFLSVNPSPLISVICLHLIENRFPVRIALKAPRWKALCLPLDCNDTISAIKNRYYVIFYSFSRHNETVWPSSHNKAYRCVYGWGVLHCNGAGCIWRGKNNFKSLSLLHHFMTLFILCVLIVFRWGHIFKKIDIQLTWKHFLVTFSNSARLCHILRARISYTGRL